MKVKITALLLATIMLLAGCGADTTVKEDTSAQGELPKEEITDPEKLAAVNFLKQHVNTDARPIAVMVDNDNDDARPQEGLNDAYLIYEMVVEGGATRFMAFYRNADTEKIGPIRSSRHYFLDYVMENDAIYTHFGWSPKAMQDISALGINKINGILGTDEDIFWREKKFRGDWHSAYTSIEKITEMAKTKGYKVATDHKNAIEYADEYVNIGSEKAANEVTLKYSYKYTTGYSFDAETQTYHKSINNKPHLMQSGDAVGVRNIIIQLIGDTSLGDGSDRRNVNTTGSGKGYYITGGEYEEIIWSKPSRRENTVYKKQDGTPLVINPGKTIINIISPAAGIDIE